MSLEGKVATVTRGGVRLEQDGAGIAVWNLNAAGAAETVVAIGRAGDRLRRRRVGPDELAARNPAMATPSMALYAPFLQAIKDGPVEKVK